MRPFPDWISELPKVDTSHLEGLEGRLLSGLHGQAVFFWAAQDVDVPPHSHGAQYGIVLAGQVKLVVGEAKRVLKPGDTYEIPVGAEHRGQLRAGTALVEIFQETDRYNPE